MPESERFQGANVVDAGRLSPYWGEHAARYVFALPYVEGKNVLDIACGTGYGIGLMQTKAVSVTGVDLDQEAVLEAAKECSENASVLFGNCLSLPFADESFDMITSFETLEHLHHRSTFVSELHRVLQPGGTLLLSTPNANYSQPVDGKPANPFHIHEYTPDELRKELNGPFAVEQLLGQTLSDSFRISPFYEGQQRLPRDLKTLAALFGWKVFNKIPLAARERLSGAIWGRPFYPTEMDYNFNEQTADTAPTLVAVCRKA